MWIEPERDDKAEPVPNGEAFDHFCRDCERSTRFVEHRLLKTYEVQSVELFRHDARHVMRCEVCGASFTTDALVDGETPQDGTVAGSVGSALSRAAAAIEQSPVTARAEENLEELANKATDALSETKKRFAALWRKKR